MVKGKLKTPYVLPIAAFALVITVGTFLLYWPACAAGEPVALVDALFISTSAVCVTGLASIDVASMFNRQGHVVMMVLMQLGGIGIVTYSSLIFYMLSRKVSLDDRLAVGQVLLYDSSFHLGKFLQRIVLFIFSIELVGASFLYMLEPERVGVFNSLFLAISSFCNAGFALWTDNLAGFRYSVGVNFIVMALIILGGLGFAVLDESFRLFWRRLFAPWFKRDGAMFTPRLSYASRLVLKTTLFLILAGTVFIYISEHLNPHSGDTTWLTCLFQSVTSRTAGFNTLDIGALTDLSLCLIIMLMFIGASPASCGGGIKTTTFRVLLALAVAQIRGRAQLVVQGRGISAPTLQKALVLLVFSLITIAVATLLLMFTETSSYAHRNAPLSALDLFFEVVSAFATVGLSTGITPELSEGGKIIICLVMFIGRLGPIWFITTLQQFSQQPKYRWPESELPIG